MQYPHDIMLKTYTLQYWQYINFCINRKEKKTHHLTIQAKKSICECNTYSEHK